MAQSTHRSWPLSGINRPSNEADRSDRAPGPCEATDLTLEEATDLLDWLEGHGVRADEVVLTENGRVTVRWVG
jgi:hypothetical protein